MGVLVRVFSDMCFRTHKLLRKSSVRSVHARAHMPVGIVWPCFPEGNRERAWRVGTRLARVSCKQSGTRFARVHFSLAGHIKLYMMTCLRSQAPFQV